MSYLDFIYTEGEIGLLKAVIAPFLDIFGYWFFAIMYFLALGMLWIKNQNVYIAAIIGMIVGFAMRTLLPPEAHSVAYLFIALGIASIVFRRLGR